MKEQNLEDENSLKMNWLVLEERNYNSSQQDEQVVAIRVVIVVVEEVEELGLRVDWVMVFRMGVKVLWNERLRESG